jgi:hypothetical protein
MTGNIPPSLCKWFMIGRIAAVATVTLTLFGWPASPSAQTVANPAPDRLWGGCVLARNDASALSSQLGSAFDFVVLYSLQVHDGQPVQTPTASGQTGPVVCTAPGVSIKSYSEGTDLPNSDTGGSSIDIFTPVHGLLVRYEKIATVEKRICHATGAIRECRTVRAGSGGCVIPSTTYTSIVRTLQGERSRTIVDDGVNFALAVAYSFSSAALPKLCAAPGFTAAAAPDSTAIPASIAILETEEATGMRYRINGGARNGQTEMRLCHTVASKTDCFRIFR